MWKRVFWALATTVSVLNILEQESETLRGWRLHQKMRQYEKTGWKLARSINRRQWCMKMLPAKKKKKKQQPSVGCALLPFHSYGCWVPMLGTMRSESQGWFPGSSVLIFHNKLLTDGAFRNISSQCGFLFTSFLITCDGVAVSNPAGILFPPGYVEFEGHQMKLMLKW